MENNKYIISKDDVILVTGAAGFVGPYLVGTLLDMGFDQIRCFVRDSSDVSRLEDVIRFRNAAYRTDIIRGNLLRVEDCIKASMNVAVVYHLAAGTGTKSFSEAFLNSVVTTRNLVEAALASKTLKRFVNISSFSVYTNRDRNKKILDESCQVEKNAEKKNRAYSYGKIKQEQLIKQYEKERSLPCVILRPGVIYGPDKAFNMGRIGLDNFGVFLHLGGGNPIPITYVENCAYAIALAGIVPGIDGEVFNVVDDDIPTSRKIIRLYKKKVKKFKSIYIPKVMSLLFYVMWEKLSKWSKGQIPPVYTYDEWIASWRKRHFNNNKLKEKLGWKQRISTKDALKITFESHFYRSKRH